MKKVLLVLATLCCGNLLWSQDIITLKNGEEIKAVVQEVGIAEVKYKKYENLTGPTYTLPKSAIFMIKYKNGEKDLFNEITEVRQPTQAESPTAINPNEKMLQVKNFDVADYSGRVLKKSEVRSIMEKSSETWDLYNRSLFWNASATVLMVGAAGGILYGVFAKDDGLYGIVGGVGCLALSVPCILGSISLREKAVKKYNAINGFDAPKLTFGITNSGGIGLTLNF